MYTMDDHSFMICAYRENPYLEDCIRSLLAQKALGKIRIVTSTPNAHIEGLARKYGLELLQSPGGPTAAYDWNFAYAKADTPLVTLCHQDDLYCPEYLETALARIARSRRMLILHTGYWERRGRERTASDRNLKIKRLLNFPLRFRWAWGWRWLRRRALSVGNPICCPSVLFNKDTVPDPPFALHMRNSMDWLAWVRLSKARGDFIYCPERLMEHRIWPGSLTTELIGNNVRTQEELEILRMFWPAPIARAIGKAFQGAQKSNQL